DTRQRQAALSPLGRNDAGAVRLRSVARDPARRHRGRHPTSPRQLFDGTTSAWDSSICNPNPVGGPFISPRSPPSPLVAVHATCNPLTDESWNVRSAFTPELCRYVYEHDDELGSGFAAVS